MAQLRMNSHGRFYFRAKRKNKFTTHSLSVHGETWLQKLHVVVGKIIPIFALRKLDQWMMVFPSSGHFRGQLEFSGKGFDEVTYSPNPKPVRNKKTRDVNVSSSQPNLF